MVRAGPVLIIHDLVSHCLVVISHLLECLQSNVLMLQEELHVCIRSQLSVILPRWPVLLVASVRGSGRIGSLRDSRGEEPMTIWHVVIFFSLIAPLVRILLFFSINFILLEKWTSNWLPLVVCFIDDWWLISRSEICISFWRVGAHVGPILSDTTQRWRHRTMLIFALFRSYLEIRFFLSGEKLFSVDHVPFVGLISK